MFAFLVAVGIIIPSTLAQFPCPNAVDILPCHCYVDEGEIDIDCSNIDYVDQIKNAFMADMPFTEFRKLTISRELDGSAALPIEKLDDRVFGSASFREVVIFNSYLSEIGANVFEKSFNTLENLTISHGLLYRYNFAMLNMYSKLTRLDLSHNRLTFMSDIVSTSLQSLDLSWNGIDYSSPEVFVGAQELRSISLAHVDMHSLTPLMFSAQRHLDFLDLTGNFLHLLPTDGLWFPNNTVTNIVLDNNFVMDLKVEFIYGTSTRLNLSMKNNSLTDLPEPIWKPVFEKVSKNTKSRIVFGETKISCGCNVAWLVTNLKYMKIFDKSNACDDGIHFSDLDRESFAHC